MTDEADEVARGLAQVLDRIQPVVEAVVGYKAKLEAAGFSPTASEEMAMQFHHNILVAMFKGA